MKLCRAQIPSEGRFSWFTVLLLGIQLSFADVVPPNIDLPEVEKSLAGKRFHEVSSDDSGVNFINSWKAPRDYERALTLSFGCLLYTSPSPRDRTRSRMPSSA